jgi:hypothetical protein
MNAMTLELKEVCQTILPSSLVPLPTQPSHLDGNPKIVAEVARWFFPSWEPLEPISESINPAICTKKVDKATNKKT